MGRQWTPQQKNAIYATEGSVLVSAAAGSGKTAVLVERVIQLITRENNPIDVDRLLIVTFTRAAAAEMRQRISAALTLLLEKDPYDPQLLKQKQLLYNASISTIDSFCSDIVQEYFHSLNISRDFRVADKGELDILSKEALDRAFEKFYSKNDSDFIDLVNAFSSKNGDAKLRETVLTVCKFLSTQPFPEKWLEDMLENYEDKPITETIWGKIIIDYSSSAVLHAINLTENSLKMLMEDAALKEAAEPLLMGDNAFLASLQKQLMGGKWDDIAACLDSFVSGKLSAPKGYKDNPIKMAIASNRDELKATVKTLKSYFMWSESEVKDEISDLHNLVSVLFDLVREYTNVFSKLKSQKNILSFADIELLTVKLLARPDGENYCKTPQAFEISHRYDAVMVDEFQDVNDVQDIIFKCVSNDENNLFVVGDVKQSIYGFRQAKPEIFINRKNSYNRYDENDPKYPAAIFLDRNFRSRKEVCETVNFIFKKLMTKDSAQMDYSKDEELNVGASYAESSDCDFELTLIENNAFENCDPSEIEARYIANKILSMISSGFAVKDGNLTRRATYGDFAVILRSTKNEAITYVNVLNSCGVPAYSEKKENSFETQEIKIVLNLLRVIDNPTLEIPLLSVMCSPIYGFSPDELAQIKANDRYSNLYSSLIEYSKTSEKAAGFISELSELRAFAYTSGVDDLIGKIYETTAFGAVTCAVKGGANPEKNLNLLREYARSFESNGYKSLSEFISYIDRLVENGTELPASSGTDGENLNRVRVLNIHKSKGLEFPVCFLADTAHKFNKEDLKSDILIDSHAGIGIRKKVDFCRFNTLPHLAVGIEIERNKIAEELRVLYVALTRAKEKLIAVSSKKNVKKYLENLNSKIIFNKIIEPYTVVRCGSISDWLCLCALVHPSMNKIRMSLDPSTAAIVYDENTVNWNVQIVDDPKAVLGADNYAENDISKKAIENAACYTKDCVSLLKRNIEFKYRNSDILNLPQKVSASQIAHEQNSDYFEKVLSKPAFLNKEISSSVERGTAHHKFLQHCSFAAARISLNDEIERLVSTGLLTKEQADCIDTLKISELLSSELITRIINSSAVFREERFTAKINPSLIYDEYKNTDVKESIIMQGAVDLAFEEGGELVIVDYKTDRVRDIKKLKNLYSKQLELYKEAMQQCTEMKVKECIICSVHLNRYISV